jgi:hypothetical protein
MATTDGRHVALGIIFLLGVLAIPSWSWGQTTERIGTVLAVEGVAEVRAAQAQTTEWERLRFRDGIFLNDTVRTAADSTMKVLLRDDSIVTLAEQSEMQFTDFLLTQQQRRSIVNLYVGKIRMLTTRLFGTGSVAEVHTPNAVAGVRGSDEHVQYVASLQQTTVLCDSGDCYMSNPTQPSQILTVPVGHIAQQIGAPGLPAITREATTTEQQTMSVGTQITEQDPQETQTTEQQALQQTQTPAGPPRGETAATAPTGPPPSTIITAAALPPAPAFLPTDTLVSPLTTNPTSRENNPQNTAIPDASVSPPAQNIIRNASLTVIVTIPR